MKDRIFYWVKMYFGFSRKESNGFLVLIPFLLILGLMPDGIRSFKNKNAQADYGRYQEKLDSLQVLQVQLVASPQPTFNPQDTVKSSGNRRQTENLNRIAFSEADSVTLQIVPGIGPATAGRIIKYREALGGFHSQSQLLEVYGVDAALVGKIQEYFDIDSKIIRRVPLNSSGVDELAAHPYISYGEAKVLVAYRNQHGKFSEVDQLSEIKIFKTEWLTKIKPYLSLD